MPPTIDVRPGTKIDPAANTHYRLLPCSGGEYHLPIVVKSDRKNVRIFGHPDYPVEELPVKGTKDARTEFGIRINDRCNGWQLEHLTLLNSGHNLRATESPDFLLRDVRSYDPGAECYHISHCRNGVIEAIFGSVKNAWRFQDYTPDKRHILYLAGNCSGTTLDGLEGEDTDGSFVQLNASSTPERGPSEGVRLENLAARRCGDGGTLTFSVMFARGLVVVNYQFEDCNGHATFHNDQGNSRACSSENCTFSGFTLVRTQNKINWADQSEDMGNEFTAAPGYVPPGTPEPPIDPEPPVVDTCPEQLAAAREELAASQATVAAQAEQLAAWEAWYGTAPVGATP
jgi:hypothetical protein